MDIQNHLNPPGSQHVFRSGVNLAIILDTNPYSKIYKGVIERRDLFDLRNRNIEHPHLTLHMINFNYKHPFMKKFKILKNMKSISKECYNKVLRGYKLKSDNNYELLGKPQDPTYVIKYKLNYPNRITLFRLCLYDKIAELIGLKDHTSFKGKLVRKLENNRKVFVYSTPDGMPLYAIHEYYHGQSNWEPHISLLKLKEESLSSAMELGELFFKTKDYKSIDRKDISAIKPFRGEPKIVINDLSLNEYNFGKIKISTIGAVKLIDYTGATKRSKRRRTSKRRKTSKKQKTSKTKKTKRRKTKNRTKRKRNRN